MANERKETIGEIPLEITSRNSVRNEIASTERIYGFEVFLESEIVLFF